MMSCVISLFLILGTETKEPVPFQQHRDGILHPQIPSHLTPSQPFPKQTAALHRDPLTRRSYTQCKIFATASERFPYPTLG